MYSVTREDAADRLNVSTRSIDRYIKAGKLRSKKDGKIVYIHERDIENMAPNSESSQAEVITERPKTYSYSQNSEHNTQTRDPLRDVRIAEDPSSAIALQKIYMDLRSEIKTKDQAIQDLSIKLGQAQEIAKNSVSLIEYKKSQYLLEESKGHLSQELTMSKNQENELRQKLKYEKSTNYILISFCIVLVLVIGFVWFLKI
ncbi:helix-turn-helix domain-containing protein [Candidatus Gracilibacteria bacterium]|nr:helix-turn-helix domain-containing protein [Candidatus Gracilibacteria bacterium]